MLSNKIVIAMVGVLFSIVVLYNLNFFLNKRVPAGPQDKAATAVLPEVNDRPESFRLTPHVQISRDRGNWRRDPFRYKVDEEKKRAGLVKPRGAPEKSKAAAIRLEGIIIRDSTHFALVNGSVVAVGDSIDGVMIADITPWSIFVIDAAGVREIRMFTDVREINMSAEVPEEEE